MVVDQASSSAVDAIKVSVIKLPRFSYPALKKTVTANISGKDKGEVPSMSYVVMFVAEFIGTGLLMFMGCLGGIYQFDLPTIPIHHMGGLVFGLTVMTIIQIFGHISGAHLNPAVTIASVLLGTLRPLMAVVYVLAQFSGAILGFGLLKILGPEEYITDGFCSTTVHSTITPFQALGIEIVITTVLILVCCAVWDKRNGHKEDSIPLRFGLIIAVISMGAGPLTGASMNTARSFAPLVFGGSWQHHWIYWVGPNISAFIGCGIYQLLFALPNDEESDKSKSENVYLEEVSPDSAEKV